MNIKDTHENQESLALIAKKVQLRNEYEFALKYQAPRYSNGLIGKIKRIIFRFSFDESKIAEYTFDIRTERIHPILEIEIAQLNSEIAKLTASISTD